MENDLIRRSDVLNSKVFMCGGDPCEPYFDGYSTALDKVEDVVKAIPAVDAVEVVCCRECKHRNEEEKNMSGYYRCDRYELWQDEEWRVYMPLDGFCSYGQRREDGDA